MSSGAWPSRRRADRVADRIAPNPLAQRLLVTTPFRLGEPVNLRYGIATISGDEQALRLHESLVARLWEGALTGARALDEIARMMKP